MCGTEDATCRLPLLSGCSRILLNFCSGHCQSRGLSVEGHFSPCRCWSSYLLGASAEGGKASLIMSKSGSDWGWGGGEDIGWTIWGVTLRAIRAGSPGLASGNRKCRAEVLSPITCWSCHLPRCLCNSAPLGKPNTSNSGLRNALSSPLTPCCGEGCRLSWDHFLRDNAATIISILSVTISFLLPAFPPGPCFPSFLRWKAGLLIRDPHSWLTITCLITPVCWNVITPF